MQFSDLISSNLLVSFTPNGKWLIGCAGNRVFVRAVQSASKLPIVQYITLTDIPSEIVVSPDSEMFFACMPKKNLVEAHRIDAKWSAKFEDQLSGLVAARWSPDSRHILTFSDLQYKLTIHDLTQQNPVYFRFLKHSNKGCSFSSDGRFMALAERRDAKEYIGVYDTQSWSLLSHLPIDTFDLADCEWSPNNFYIAVWDNCINFKFLSLCPMNGVVGRYQPEEDGLGIKCVEYSHNSSFVALGCYDDSIRLINAISWKLITQLPCLPNSISEKSKVYIQEDSKQSKNSRTTVMTLHQATSANKAIIKTSEKNAIQQLQGISLTHFSSSDQFLAAKNDSIPNTLWLWNTKTLKLHSVLIFQHFIKSFKWSPSLKLLCILTGNGKLYFWRPQNCYIFQLKQEWSKLQPLTCEWHSSGNMLLMIDKAQCFTCSIPYMLSKD